MNEKLKDLIGNSLRDAYLAGQITIEKAQQIAEEVLDLAKSNLSAGESKLQIVKLSLKFPEISQVIEKYFTTL